MKFSRRAERDSELDLEEGDVILIFDKQKSGWWRGMIGEREGLFPVNYLQGCTFVRQLSHHILSICCCCLLNLKLGHLICSSFYGRFSKDSTVFLSC